jgi:hypothetical protein
MQIKITNDKTRQRTHEVSSRLNRSISGKKETKLGRRIACGKAEL